MPAPLELLYQLRPFDAVTDLWGTRFHQTLQLTNQAGAQHFHASFTPPDDKVLFVTGLWIWADPTATRSVVDLRPVLLAEAVTIAGTPGTEIMDLGRAHFPDALDLGREIYRKVDFTIAGGQQHISAIVTFDAGSVTNVSRWGLQGFEVARGNVVLR